MSYNPHIPRDCGSPEFRFHKKCGRKAWMFCFPSIYSVHFLRRKLNSAYQVPHCSPFPGHLCVVCSDTFPTVLSLLEAASSARLSPCFSFQPCSHCLEITCSSVTFCNVLLFKVICIISEPHGFQAFCCWMLFSCITLLSLVSDQANLDKSQFGEKRRGKPTVICNTVWF